MTSEPDIDSPAARSVRPSVPRVQPVEKVIARMQERSTLGGLVRPINLAATLAHNRPVRAAVDAFAGTFFDPDVIDPRLRELVVLRMAWKTQSAYEFGQHVLAARAVGISEAEIARTTTDPVGDGGWSPLESLAFRMVDDIYRDDCVADETWASLAEMLDDEHLIALVGLACCYRMVAGILNSLGIQPEDDLPGWPTA
jgi:alkylhydroperoxidase family enzyme